MIRQPYILALGAFLLIPIVAVFGMAASDLINPEYAGHFTHYERNFRLPNLAKSLLRLATLLCVAGLWLLMCILLIKAKGRSLRWLPLSILGPIGFILVSMLNDAAAKSGSPYQSLVKKLTPPVRVIYELLSFLLIGSMAFGCVAMVHELMTRYQSATTGVPLSQLNQIQNASSGMWAFGDGLETLFLVVAFFLARPIIYNIASHLWRRFVPSLTR